MADVNISNKGTSASDFTIIYCIVAEQSNMCGDDDDVDYNSLTQYILGGQTLTKNLQLEIPTNGSYYFKVKAKSLSEVNWAGASRLFQAILLPSDTIQDGNGQGIISSSLKKEEEDKSQPTQTFDDYIINYGIITIIIVGLFFVIKRI